MAADRRRGGRPPRSSRLSIRVRTTLGATAVVGVALVVAGVLVVLLLRRNLTASVDAAADLRVEDLVVALEDGRAPAELVAGDGDEVLVQVVAEDGRVLAASEDLAGVAALATDEVEGRAVDVPDESDPYRLVAEGVDLGDDDGLVVVARSAEAVEEGTETVAGSLLVGIPVLVLLVAGTTWVVTGRSLRPVEAIRREVAAITDAELDRRVPAPGGRDEVARLAGTMNAMLDRLEAGRDRSRRFVSDASHELRSPIATIRHELEVARADPSVVDVAALADRLLAEDLRMQALVEDLLLLARSDEGRLAAVRRPVDVDDLVLAEATRLRSLGGPTVDASAVTAGQVVGDAAQLGRVVRNLADNAARHARTTVRVGVAASGPTVRLWVADDGPGIPEADRERVFERFTRLDTSRTRATGGYGLGLAIAAEVVRAHGGRISIGDGPDGGAQVVVELPASGT
ncbi:HAMP domain-containing protein [Iamia sp. SCSIO 61187]|uniref:sensor histidine kinase n=1 Tax=Iamia sp. SCSIO 61187 TaxID=2722752 RepID=UPI001C632407|nr:ATP-binding protein [Iamia sp. SCSIO 61187]QYG91358.1 HAMP domain-containing protein [Iamia sp. SCSIO 61187]